jgi:hypothetical protein
MIRRFIISFVLIVSVGAAQAQLFAQEYRVALILPFKSEGTQNSLSEAMLDYYEGFKMATSYLESEGLRMKLYVFDSEKDSNALETILEHRDMKKMDVIVGPVYEKNLAMAEAFCAKHRILLVSPLKYYVPKEAKSEVINFFAPDSMRVGSIAQKCGRFFYKHKIYIVQDNTKQSQADALLMRKKLREQNVPFVRITTLANGKLTPLPAHTDSVILISATSSRDAKSLLTKAIKNKYQSFVIAHLDWNAAVPSTFEIDEPQVIYPEVNFVSYHDTFASSFRNNFFDLYYGEPSKYAYIGYDQGMYLSYGLMTFGRNFSRHLPDAEFRGLINVIKLTDSENGMVNLGLNYLQIIEEERLEYAP